MRIEDLSDHGGDMLAAAEMDYHGAVDTTGRAREEMQESEARYRASRRSFAIWNRPLLNPSAGPSPTSFVDADFMHMVDPFEAGDEATELMFRHGPCWVRV